MMESETAPARRLVHLRLKPLWMYVDTVREFCDFFARASFEKEEVGQRVGLVVHELMENAIRYGSEDDDLDLSIERNEGVVVVRVANTASEASARGLQEVFAALHTLPPCDAYVYALQNVSQRAAHESGLGLARVRFEGQVDLGLQVSPGRVCITARGRA